MTCGDKLFNIVGESAYNTYSAWWILLGSSMRCAHFHIERGTSHATVIRAFIIIIYTYISFYHSGFLPVSCLFLLSGLLRRTNQIRSWTT